MIMRRFALLCLAAALWLSPVAADSADTESLSRFVILSDLHPHPSAFEQMETLTSHVIELAPAFVVVLGDIAGDEVPGWSEPEIAVIRTAFNRLLAAGIEVYPVMGNHDVHHRVRDLKSEWFCSADPLPLNPLLGPGDETGARDRFLNGGPYNYAFNRGGLRFVVVDSNIVPPKESWEPERIAQETPRWEAHREWMAEAFCNPASNPDRLPTLVFIHHPEYLTGDRRMDSRPLFHALEGCREVQTVRALFGGHWHYYEAFPPENNLGVLAWATPPSNHSHDSAVEFIVAEVEGGQVRFEVRDSNTGQPTGVERYTAVDLTPAAAPVGAE